MRFILFTIISCLLFVADMSAQGKHPSKSKAESKRLSPQDMGKLSPLKKKPQANAVPLATRNFKSLGAFTPPQLNEPNLTFLNDAETDLPILIKGSVGAKEKGNTLLERCYSYLEVVKDQMQIEKAAQEFVTHKVETDEIGMTHIRLQQVFKGIPVYGSEVMLHEKNGHIRSLNGRYFPTPKVENLNPLINENTAIEIAYDNVKNHTNLANIPTHQKHLVSANTQELVIYHPSLNVDGERLVWHISFHPNIREKWNYFVDAQTGEILDAHRASCSFACMHTHNAVETCTHENEEKNEVQAAQAKTTLAGPVTANATDLFGISRTINVYEEQGTYFMIDASRPMFNFNQSNFPNEPVGTIWTIDGNNTAPQSSNFNTTHVTSSNNSWNSPISVSAHYNGGVAYEYFRTTFNRNSINGQGGNIVSIINVADENGNSMDNAFWNGAAMFYGNGGQAFDPLAKALDVAGHEMSHGVIQRTANLEYVAQSGALNESFADIFGAMIDRNDWKMGEDIVNTQFFPSGALRDLQNPNNGGSQLGDAGWQPAHMNEYANLPNTAQGDFGGVHINSGIPNRAFYLLASNVGKSNAEEIFYRALTNYLTKSSQFIDCRIAVIQAATDLFGAGSNEVAAANNAFTQVGIGSGTGTTTQENIEENPGAEFILLSDESLSQIYVVEPSGNNLQVLSGSSPISKPSITDDGSFVVFIDNQSRMRSIFIDWNTGAVEEDNLSPDTGWRNVAVSKDGERIAAITDDQDNIIWVFDFGLQQWNTYELYNPTFTQGISTGDVQYADVLEWDFTGEHVMYDAFNVISGQFGEDISYWDIGFVKVWNNSTNNWNSPEGNIEKLFSGLPENTSVGNPTFSKNSDFIVAFDFIDEDGNAQLFAANVETGETSAQPIFTNGILNYPNYSVDDSRIIFDFNDSSLGQILGYRQVQNDKINGQGDATLLIEGGKWGVWFAIGERELVNVDYIDAAEWGISIFPNPTSSMLNIQGDIIIEDDIDLSLTDLAGKEILRTSIAPNGRNWNHQLDLSQLSAGSYFLQMRSGQQLMVQKVVKF